MSPSELREKIGLLEGIVGRDQDDMSHLEAAAVAANQPAFVEALKNRRAEQKRLAAEKAVDVVVEMEEVAAARIQERINLIRNLRRQEKQLKSELEGISAALEYARETMDYRPLAAGFGFGYAGHRVPDNWTSKSKEQPVAKKPMAKAKQ